MERRPHPEGESPQSGADAEPDGSGLAIPKRPGPAGTGCRDRISCFLLLSALGWYDSLPLVGPG